MTNEIDNTGAQTLFMEAATPSRPTRVPSQPPFRHVEVPFDRQTLRDWDNHARQAAAEGRESATLGAPKGTTWFEDGQAVSEDEGWSTEVVINAMTPDAPLVEAVVATDRHGIEYAAEGASIARLTEALDAGRDVYAGSDREADALRDRLAAFTDDVSTHQRTTKMTDPIKIVFDRERASVAPLFAHYPGQIEPQPAFVTLDLRNGNVDADYSGGVGPGMPADVWHGMVRRYPVRNDLSRDQVAQVIDGIKGTLQTIYDHGEVGMYNGNPIGRLDDTGKAAEDSLPDLIGADMESRVITNLEEWLREAGEDAWTPTEDEDVADYIQTSRNEIETDGWLIAEDIDDVLMEMWADKLYDGKPIQKNVAQALLDDGRCEDSAWMDELNAYAAGRDPDEDMTTGDTSQSSQAAPSM